MAGRSSSRRPQRGRLRDARNRRARFVTRLRLDWWWIAILLICGSFQIYRGAPIDGAFFLAAGAALLADAAGWLRRLDRYPLPRLHLAVQIVLGVLAVAVITLAPQWSVADLVVVCVIGATAVIVSWRGDDIYPVDTEAERSVEQAEALRRAAVRSAVLWACAGVFLCLWELLHFFLAMPSPQAEWDHPVLSDLIDPIVANPIGRAVCATLWILGGAALLRRGRHP